MEIAVCIKQVPDTNDIKWTENNTIQREGVESIINPFDEYAIESAVRLKESVGGHITVITMGPNQAEDILRKAMAMGCDDAFLVSDKKFSGADTVATSKTLAQAIKEKIPKVDLIICGQFATDGDTAQTGPSIAQNLDFPQATYVKEIIVADDTTITVKKEIEDGIETLKIKLPALICMQKCDYEPRIPRILGYIKAQDNNIPVFNAEAINIDSSEVGIKGSPTYVSKAFRPEQKKRGEIIQFTPNDDSIQNLCSKIKDFLSQEGGV
ncbi:MAG: electron transfer flavoprotein subunit beta/FixA family protein [Candidatus Gastranaerophilales bacterium]|nr:electron transfer flavoprotein subunit beta/FixA family protein [Candidatus Gastranaerophilales bacterium]